MPDHGGLTTAEAAARLGVKTTTLYAYVSRGQLRRTRTPSGSRFDPGDVAELARRSRRPAAPVGNATALVTGLTLIDGGRYFYRGRDAVELSRRHRFEEVAGWLWSAEWPDPAEEWHATQEQRRAATDAVANLPAGGAPADRWRVAVAAAATADPLRHDRSPLAVAATARGIIAMLVDVLPAMGRWPGATSRREAAGVAARLWTRLCPLPPTTGQVRLLDAALVLMADHELAASTLAVRAAAASAAHPYAVVLTGLAAASGPRHGAASLQVRPVLDAAERRGAAAAVGEVLDRGEVLYGFGQVLYPAGDPRAAELLARLRATPVTMASTDGVVDLARGRGLPPPNVDFALAALAQTAGMVPGASEAVFLLGRVAGWIAHALEEYQGRRPWRWRADYVGPPPASGPAAGGPGGHADAE